MSDTFQWTDELKEKYISYLEDRLSGKDTIRKVFIQEQSKQNSNKDWEIVSLVYEYDSKYIFSQIGNTDLYACSEFPNEYFKLYEDLLNNKNGKIYLIKSVKRLSDGEVFSVGDEIEGVSAIQSIREDKYGISLIARQGVATLKYAKKAKQRLFKTEDGKDIYAGDEYWYADIKESSSPLPQKYNATLGGIYGKSYASKAFSTEQAAKEYIIMNKPCLSLKEILEVFKMIYYGYGLNHQSLESKLKQLIQQKIEKQN